MSEASTPSHSDFWVGFGTNAHGESGSARSRYPLGVTLPSESQEDNNMAPLLPVLPLDATSITHERTVAELTIRSVSQEIELAQHELAELEKGLVQEMHALSVRGWLLPLMVIGLALSFFGGLWSTTPAQLGATALVLLCSLAAFWVLYRRERLRARTEQAFNAEIEIWSKRIEELKRTLQHNQRILATTASSSQ